MAYLKRLAEAEGIEAKGTSNEGWNGAIVAVTTQAGAAAGTATVMAGLTNEKTPGWQV